MSTVEENRKAVAKMFEDYVEKQGPTFDYLVEKGLIAPHQLETLKNLSNSVVHYHFWPHQEPRVIQLDDGCFGWMMLDMITTIASLKDWWSFYFEHQPKPDKGLSLSARINPLRLTKGVNMAEMLCQNIETGVFKISTLPNRASAGNLNELAGLFFQILSEAFPEAPVLDVQTAFAEWSTSFGNDLLSKETRAALSPRVAEKYKPYRAALIALTKWFAALECKLNNDLKTAALKKKEEEKKAKDEIQTERLPDREEHVREVEQVTRKLLLLRRYKTRTKGIWRFEETCRMVEQAATGEAESGEVLPCESGWFAVALDIFMDAEKNGWDEWYSFTPREQTQIATAFLGAAKAILHWLDRNRMRDAYDQECCYKDIGFCEGTEYHLMHDLGGYDDGPNVNILKLLLFSKNERGEMSYDTTMFRRLHRDMQIDPIDCEVDDAEDVFEVAELEKYAKQFKCPDFEDTRPDEDCDAEPQSPDEPTDQHVMATEPTDKVSVTDRILADALTKKSLEEAREAYKSRALGIFDTGSIFGTYIAGITKQLERATSSIKSNEISPTPFEDGEAEQVAATLALTGVVYAGEYTWRGKGGNKPGDPRFDAEEVPNRTEETDLREKLIQAMIQYAQAGAAKARKLDASNAKEMFIDVATALETNYGRDRDEGFTKAEAEKIVADFVKATRFLYGEIRAYLISKGEALTKEQQSHLLERLNDSLKNMEDVTATALFAIRKEKDRTKKIERILAAIDVIGVQLQETFLPLALQYGVEEEAAPYDETRATCLLMELASEVFDRDSIEYYNCDEEIENLKEVIAHPVSKSKPGVYYGKNDKGDCVVYLPSSYSVFVRLIEAVKPAESLPLSPPPPPPSGMTTEDAVAELKEAIASGAAKTTAAINDGVRSLKDALPKKGELSDQQTDVPRSGAVELLQKVRNAVVESLDAARKRNTKRAYLIFNDNEAKKAICDLFERTFTIGQLEAAELKKLWYETRKAIIDYLLFLSFHSVKEAETAAKCFADKGVWNITERLENDTRGASILRVEVTKELYEYFYNYQIVEEGNYSAIDFADSDWVKWPERKPRFKCDINHNFANIVDTKHMDNPDFPRIGPYIGMPESAQKVIKLLIGAASRNDAEHWWIKSTYDNGKAFSGAFQESSKTARRFYNEQIEVGTNNYHKGEWRILPTEMFATRYREIYPKTDPLAGS